MSLVALAVVVDAQQFVVRERRIEAVVRVDVLALARIDEHPIARVHAVGPNLVDLAAQFEIGAEAVGVQNGTSAISAGVRPATRSSTICSSEGTASRATRLRLFSVVVSQRRLARRRLSRLC